MLEWAVVDGCKTAIANELLGIDPWDAEFGTLVKAVCNRQRNAKAQ